MAKRLLAIGMLAALASAGTWAGAAATTLTADQIVEKNAAARGGIDAWRAVQTMVWIGHVEGANAPAQSLPFMLELKRPNKTRFEINAPNQKSVRVFDGRSGWKIRPGRSSGAPEAQAFGPDEVRFARDEQVIDGLLMDHAAKGVGVAMEGIDEVGGRKAYRLAIKSASGAASRLWVDAETFLEVKQERESRNSPSGRATTVSVFLRNYRSVDGLQIPLTIESGAGEGKVGDRLVIERVAVNPPLDDRQFAKPGTPVRRGVVTVGTDASPSGGTLPQPTR